MRLKTGIVFSGGFAKGAYQVGVCKAIKAHPRFEIDAVSAASVGMLNAYALLSGKLDSAVRLWKSINAKSYRDFFGNILCKGGIYDRIDNFCCEDDMLAAPLFCVLRNVSTDTTDYLRMDSFPICERKALLKAGISVPYLMSPIAINNSYYCDGAIIDNVPISPLRQVPLDLIIVIQFDNYVDSREESRFSCPIIYLNLQRDNIRLNSFSMDSGSIDEMISYGEQSADVIISYIENHSTTFPDDLSNLAGKINCGMKQGRPSGDALMRRINHLSRLF
ncbi:MAG: patatin-like phospholipase family protein [Oscillospiraceae bacterium]|nr:patatin-like phospholipase family protein [Oscillospiraceae bacterium]